MCAARSRRSRPGRARGLLQRRPPIPRIARRLPVRFLRRRTGRPGRSPPACRRPPDSNQEKSARVLHYQVGNVIHGPRPSLLTPPPGADWRRVRPVCVSSDVVSTARDSANPRCHVCPVRFDLAAGRAPERAIGVRFGLDGHRLVTTGIDGGERNRSPILPRPARSSTCARSPVTRAPSMCVPRVLCRHVRTIWVRSM
jgi:hypothetical protein